MSAALAADFRMFGHYNAWANDRLFAAAGRADRGAFFKSIHGTLNHLLATDRIWMRGRRPTASMRSCSRPSTISVPHARPEDRRIVDFIEGLDESRLASTIKYRRVSSPQPAGSNWRLRWRTGSTTRPTIAVRSTPS